MPDTPPADVSLGEVWRSLSRLTDQVGELPERIAAQVDRALSSHAEKLAEHGQALTGLRDSLAAESKARAAEISAEREARHAEIAAEKAKMGVTLRWCFSGLAVAMGAAVAQAIGIHL